MARRGPAGRPVVITVAVAVGLTLLALIGAILLRPHQTGSGANSGAAPSTAASTQLECDDGPCRPLASASVAGSTVQLLANTAATSGRVRITTAQDLNSVFETTIGQLGATLTAQSLTCVHATAPACMVSGSGPEGSAGEVFVQTNGDWERADAPYFASGGYLACAGQARRAPRWSPRRSNVTRISPPSAPAPRCTCRFSRSPGQRSAAPPRSANSTGYPAGRP